MRHPRRRGAHSGQNAHRRRDRLRHPHLLLRDERPEKTLLDRTNPLFPAEYRFRDVYLPAAAADGEESAVDGAVQRLKGWVACFDRAGLARVLRGVGVDGPGAIRARPALLEQAAHMGAGV